MQQLLYGSADQIPGRPTGGWGVLHQSPDLTPDTAQRLVKLASVEMTPTVPQFPSQQDLANRPPRFRLDFVQGEYAACRSVEAGTDHTGRPGNVVSHCARISPVDGVRPVDWFFSPGWLTPFGPRAIAEAVLPAELVPAGGWEATAAWLRQHDSTRLSRLRWIADVGLELLLQGRSLVLKAPTVTETARWASVLTWLLSSQLAGLVPLRIGEDERSIGEHTGLPSVIVGVTGDAGSAVPPGMQVLDTTWELDALAAERAGVWTLPTGGSHPARPATAIAADLAYASPDVARAVFDKRDELVDRFHGVRPDLQPLDAWLLLQLAWLSTPGAQDIAREDPIRHLLAAFDDEVLAWPEVTTLAAEIGHEPPVPTDAEERLMPDALPADPYADPAPGEPPAADPVRDAVLAAVQLTRAGVEVEELLASGTLLFNLERRSDQHQAALRAIARVLPPSSEGVTL